MVTLEPIAVNQCEELLALIDELNQADGIKTPASVIRPALEKLLHNPSLGRSWFICRDEQHVGYITLTFGYDIEYGGRDAWITDFYVRPQFQGRGIGTQALRELEKAARELEVCALHLMVREANEVARRIYFNQGFEVNPRLALIKQLRMTDFAKASIVSSAIVFNDLQDRGWIENGSC